MKEDGYQDIARKLWECNKNNIVRVTQEEWNGIYTEFNFMRKN